VFGISKLEAIKAPVSAPATVSNNSGIATLSAVLSGMQYYPLARKYALLSKYSTTREVTRPFSLAESKESIV